MATKTFYLKDVAVGAGGNGSLADGVAPTAAATATTVSPSSSNLSFNDLQVYGGAATNGDPAQPAGAPNTLGDSWRLELSPLNGTFDAGVWTFSLVETKSGAGASGVSVTFRVWKSANADGSFATELTPGIVSTASDGVAAPATATFNPGAVAFANEYLFVQIGWLETHGGVQFPVFTINVGANSFLSTPNFTAAAGAPDTGIRIQQGPALRGRPGPVSRFRSTQAFLGPPPPADPGSTSFQAFRGPRRFGPPSPVSRFRSQSAYVAPAGGALFTQAVGGTLSFLGDLLKQPQLVKSGALSGSGALLKQVQVLKSGVLASSGALLKQVQKSFAGTLSSSGAILKLVGKVLGGTLTGSGVATTIKVVLRAVGGTLGLSGTISRQVQKSLAGTLSSSGSIVKLTQRALAGGLGISGAVTKRAAKTFGGVLSFIGTLLASTGAPPVFGPALFGRQDAAGLSGKQDAAALAGKDDVAGVSGKQDAPAIAGKQDQAAAKGTVS